MTPERRPPTDAREWLNRARSSQAKSRVRAEEIYLEDLCFDAQQAAEKAIQAVMVERQIAFPYLHDLSRLLILAELSVGDAPARVREAV